MNECLSERSGRRRKKKKEKLLPGVSGVSLLYPLEKYKSQERKTKCVLLSAGSQHDACHVICTWLCTSFTNKIALLSQFFCSVSGIFLSPIPVVGISFNSPGHLQEKWPYYPYLTDEKTDSVPRKRQRST